MRPKTAQRRASRSPCGSGGTNSLTCGRARVLDHGKEREHALVLLTEKYPQYGSEPPDGPVLAVDVTDVRKWAS